MIEQCLANMKGADPGKVSFYMWIRRLYDAVNTNIREDSLYIKKQADIVREYEKITPLIYTIFEHLLGESTVIHPVELNGLSPARAVDISKEYELNTVNGVVASVTFIHQLLGFYVKHKPEGKHHFIDLFYIVIYQLLYNIHTIVKHPEPLPFVDTRGCLYVHRTRP